MTTWRDIRQPRWKKWLNKLAVGLGCILIGLVLGYLYGRAF